jgi:hypothetical protein
MSRNGRGVTRDASPYGAKAIAVADRPTFAATVSNTIAETIASRILRSRTFRTPAPLDLRLADLLSVTY